MADQYREAQIKKWHAEAEEKATRAKFADEKTAKKLRKEAQSLMWRAAKLRGRND